MSKPLSPVLTSYDFLKALALLLMVVDHTGYYFYTDETWLRVVGRFSAPIWLFLVGYARSRDISARMWIGVAVVMVANYVFGMSQLPVNILATIILCRLALDPLMGFIARNPHSLFPIALMLFFGTIVTFDFVEYGTSAMLIVMAGYIVRNADALSYDKNRVLQFAGVAGFLYGVIQFATFSDFTRTDNMIVIGGLFALMMFLTTFRPYEYPALTERLSKAGAGFLRLMGRRTLEFYVLHLVLFKALALAIGTKGEGFFVFHIH